MGDPCDAQGIVIQSASNTQSVYVFMCPPKKPPPPFHAMEGQGSGGLFCRSLGGNGFVDQIYAFL